MDDSCVAAYDNALRLGAYEDSRIAALLSCDEAEAARIRTVLTRMKLLVPGGPGGNAVPVSPDVAEAELSAGLEAGINAYREQLAEVRRQMGAITPVYVKYRQAQRASSGIRVLDGPEDVQRELTAATRECTTEAFTVQPGGGRDPRTLHEISARDTAMLERGVRMRILYQHTARANLATRTHARKMTALGAEVRTTNEIYERLIIFDRSTAFVPKERVGNRPPGAAIVTDATVVGHLWRIHDKMWSSASPYDPSDTEYAAVSEEIRTSILKLMATGLKDDVIARKLGMATRTCRRYMAGIMDDLGVTSRFQAGARASALGLVDAGTGPYTAGESGPGEPR
ncbi:LuxR C-terminal-related transcriptional regulator [Streptomyces sp. NPDC087440]|uniref:helix-turn-helix transcriptional regulator n=1 Tax=Streptomyces sp. NPDC087440 TaxID=3365790 RepID=UPI0038091CC9